MFHPNRRFRVVVEEDPRSLAEKLTKKTWPIFTGFEHGRHLLLNDSYTDEEAQDYAVFIKEPDEAGKYVQVAGFPFGWMDAGEALTVSHACCSSAHAEMSAQPSAPHKTDNIEMTTMSSN